jgi:Mrp family chromosome partitioning ATPase
MSKLYDLMQQAGIALGTFAPLTEESVAAEYLKQAPATAEVLTEAPAAIREESLKLVQRLFLTPEQDPPKVVMFAAIDSGSGCSLLSAITARLLAENVSGSVCLVNANFRTPLLPGISAGNNHYGLADALRREGAIRGFAKQGGRDNLWLLFSGAQGSDSLGVLNGDRMKERVAELRREFSFVLIDAPPLNAYGDALVVGRLVDGVVLVLEANSTRREVALRISEKLRAAKIRLLAAVLNKRTFPIPSVLYKWL